MIGLGLPLRGCPGILSYHISQQSVQRLRAGGLEELWLTKALEKEEETGGEEAGEEERVLSAVAVAKALLAAIEGVCQSWAESLPALTQVPGRIELSVQAIRNNRRKMEDRHAVCVDINSLFGLEVCLCCARLVLF